MTTQSNKEMHYGIARGENIIEGHFHRIEHAQIALDQANAQMERLGLEPDLRLVEYDVETTVKTSRPRAYKEPIAEDATPDGDTENTAQLPE